MLAAIYLEEVYLRSVAKRRAEIHVVFFFYPSFQGNHQCVLIIEKNSKGSTFRFSFSSLRVSIVAKALSSSF